MQIHAIILAGGDGNRFGGELPKQFVRLAGDPILLRTLRRLHGARIERLVVVAHPRWLDETRRLIDEAGLEMDVSVVAGGVTRNESTRNGLAALGGADDDIVLVHDAVRPLLPLEVIQRAVEPIISGRADATDTVIPSADTLVVVDGENVAEIPDPARYRRGQTPQTFRVGVLAKAYAAAEAAGDLGATDDCSLVLRYVPEARMLAVAGDEINMKITTRIDMVMADRMLQMSVLVPGPDPMPTATLEGARLLVIGGTNGIGRAIAELARAQGATAEVAGSSLGLDVRDYAGVAAWTQAAAGRLGGLDHVVCTAGVLRIGPLVDTEPASFAEVIDVNLTGSLNVARAAYPYLSASHGSITFFASSSFTRGRPDYVAYSASKAAVVNMTQGLADEWAAVGIRVNAISPERTLTPMRRKAFPSEDTTGMLGAADVAGATLRLLRSDLTGQVVDVKSHDVAGAGVSALEFRLASLVLRLLGWVFDLLPARPGRVVLATARLGVLEGNLLALHEAIRRLRPATDVVLLLEPYGYGLGAKLRYFARTVRGTYHVRTAGLVVVDNAYLPVHVAPHRRRTTVVQVWHATGALKRFGMDTVVPPAEPERTFLHRHYDYVVASGDAGREPWSRALRTPVERVLALGTPRTDAFFDAAAMAAARARVLAAHPGLAGRRVVLWAPTFRGRGRDRTGALGLDGERLRALLPADEWVLAIKTHPNVDPAVQPTAGFDVAGRPDENLNDWLAAADVLLTDYSSSIFEWALLRRPLVLLVDDLEAYARDPGLYLDYGTEMIGNQVRDTAAAAAAIIQGTVNGAAWDAFIARNMGACDGGASERFVQQFLPAGDGARDR